MPLLLLYVCVWTDAPLREGNSRLLTGEQVREAALAYQGKTAVGADGLGTDLIYTVKWPSFGAYGAFWDVYPESEAAEMEGETMSCHGSALWETADI